MRDGMTKIIWLLVAILIIFHQDFWNWENDSIVYGLPIGLTYHIGLSLAAAAVWWIACLVAWPDELKETELAEHPTGEDSE